MKLIRVNKSDRISDEEWTKAFRYMNMLTKNINSKFKFVYCHIIGSFQESDFACGMSFRGESRLGYSISDMEQIQKEIPSLLKEVKIAVEKISDKYGLTFDSRTT